jgi:hypothetical protein
MNQHIRRSVHMSFTHAVKPERNSGCHLCGVVATGRILAPSDIKSQRHPGLWEPGENRSLRTTCANINFSCECDQLQISSLKIVFHTEGQNLPDAGTTMFLEALLLLAPSESSPKSTTPRRHPATCFHISKASTIKDDCIVVRNDSPVVSCHGRCSTICQTVSFVSSRAYRSPCSCQHYFSASPSIPNAIFNIKNIENNKEKELEGPI